jgi:hypothetical protein
MRSFIVQTEDGTRHAIVTHNIKSVEHVPGKPGTPAQPAQEAREGHPGVAAVPPRPASHGVAAHPGSPGKPPVEALEEREAVKAVPGVPDSVIIHFLDGESLTVKNLSQQQVVDHINSDAIVGSHVLGSAAPARVAQQADDRDRQQLEREGHSDAVHAARQSAGNRADDGDQREDQDRSETHRKDRKK